MTETDCPMVHILFAKIHNNIITAPRVETTEPANTYGHWNRKHFAITQFAIANSWTHKTARG